MSAEVHALSRPTEDRGRPLVPAKVSLQEDEIFLRLPAAIFDSEWAVECTRDERLAGITLRTRALKQVGNAGSLPASDRLLARLADYGDDLDGWLAVKAMALAGWVPCSDGRWHHPEIARNVLHIWIGRLEARRISAWGNKGRAREGAARGLDSIMAALDGALDALAAIDPQDAVLGRGTDQQARWRRRIAGAALDADDAQAGAETPYEGPNRPPNRTPPGGGPKVRQAKRSQEDSSSPRSGDDSCGHDFEPGPEVGKGRGSADRTPTGAERERAPPWPAGYREAFRALYPKRQAWGAAERRLDQIRKAGKVPFDDVMAGVARLVDWVEGDLLALQFVPQPGNWLHDRGWEDDPPTPGAARASPRGSGSGDRPRSGAESAAYGFDAAFPGRGAPPGPLIDHDQGGRP